MDWVKLNKLQRCLSDKINDVYSLQGEDLLDRKILALQVELGELSNEIREWKFWVTDKSQRLTKECDVCRSEGLLEVITLQESYKMDVICPKCGGKGFDNNNPVIEEYVDCLHFIVDIGLEIGSEKWNNHIYKTWNMGKVDKQLNQLFYQTGVFYDSRTKDNYESIVCLFKGLGDLLGYSKDIIYGEYIRKNNINHLRLQNGY